jgi:hypothetical protein
MNLNLSMMEYNEIIEYGNYDSIIKLITKNKPNIDSVHFIVLNIRCNNKEKDLIQKILSKYKEIKEDEKKCNKINMHILLMKPYPTIKNNIEEATGLPFEISNLILQYIAFQINCISSSSSITLRTTTSKTNGVKTEGMYFNKNIKYKKKYLRLKFR